MEERQLPKSIQRAVERCYNGWVPTSSAHSERLFSLIGGQESGWRERSVELLKQDLSLCAKVVTSRPRASSPNCDEITSPLSCFSHLQGEELSSLLREAVDSGVADLQSASPNDAQVLSYALSATTATEVLAEAQGLDPDLAFCMSLCRQFGMVLALVNYPSVTAEAIRRHRESEVPLEDTFFDMLNFSLLELSDALLNRCGVASQLRGRFSQADTGGVITPGQQKLVMALQEACQHGEQFAKIHATSLFSLSDEQELATLKVMSEQIPQGVKGLAQRIESRSSLYSERLSSFKPPDYTQRPKKNRYWYLRYKENQAIQQCTHEVQTSFRESYQYLQEGCPSPIAISALSLTTVPSLGFSKGCLFLFQQSAQRFLPKLLLGGAVKEEETCSPRPVEQAYYLKRAFESPSPIFERAQVEQGEQPLFIAWRLLPNGTGVLYLQCGDSLTDAPHRVVQLGFLAVRRALIDFLCLQ